MMGSLGTLQISGNTRQNGVTNAIAQASAKTGVDFDYLVQQANVESSLNPRAKARTSSASGLYQFIEQTWLRMVKSHGAEHGYGNFANAIHQRGNGDYVVTNRNMRNTILNLRNDPKASSLMAAELATENDSYLRGALGGDPSGTDLYLAHFMGAQGAANFLKSMKKNPWVPAASIFPEAARANRGVFYAQGKPLSLQQIYNRFDAKFQNGSPATVQTASTSVSAPVHDVPEVVLPAARNWGNPDSGYRRVAQQIDQSMRQTGLLAFSAEETPSNTLGRLRTPVDVMFMAQNATRFIHDDNDRYNS